MGDEDTNRPGESESGEGYVDPMDVSPLDEAPTAPAPPTRKRDADMGLRPGDPGHDLRDIPSGSVRYLSEKQVKQMQEQHRLEQEALADEVLARSQSGWPFDHLPSWVRNLCSAAALFFIAGVGTLIYTQLVVVLSAMSTLPQAAVWALVLAAVPLLLASLAAFWTAARAYRSYRRTPGINVRGLAQLRERAALQQAAQFKRVEAAKQLREYLKEYLDGESGKFQTELLADNAEWVAKAREQLLENFENTPSDQWLDSFQKTFQARLETSAKALVNRHAVRVGAATAACPRGAVDRVIVLTMTITMMRDLMRLYGLKPSMPATLGLLAAAFSHAYLAANIEETTKAVVDNMQESLLDAMGYAAGTVVQVALPKGAEALVNMLLVRRLGHAAIRQIQPTRV